MNAQPAISRDALPVLRRDYRIACARYRNAPARLKHFWIDNMLDIRAQIKAMTTGAETWTNTAGEVYAAGLVRVSRPHPVQVFSLPSVDW